MNRDEWLRSLKVGDEVAVVSPGFLCLDVIVSTDRTFDFQHCGCVRINDGSNGWSHIEPPTPELRRRARRYQIEENIECFELERLTDEELEAMQAILDGAEGRQGE